jgi:hypothetical protein
MTDASERGLRHGLDAEITRRLALRADAVGHTAAIRNRETIQAGVRCLVPLMMLGGCPPHKWASPGRR